MDYKCIISNRELRRKILRLLCFIPDKCMLKIQYRIKMGRPLNLKNPQRYTEKIQWYKLYYKNEKMIEAVDKYYLVATVYMTHTKILYGKNFQKNLLLKTH